MTQDKLKLNDKKTEIMVIGTEAQLKKVNITNLVIGKSAVGPSQNTISNLGSWFDSSLKMDTHITKTCDRYLHNLSRIRRYLDQESTEKLIHAFVTSRLDYYNSLLYGLPDCRLLKLQRVQNAAARLVFRAPKLCHITPLLKSLHWLNIKRRIEFKLLLITYKAMHGPERPYWY